MSLQSGMQMLSSLAERPRALALAVEGGLLLALAGLAVVIGPFGTFNELSVAERLVYWGVIIPVNWLQVRLAATLIAQKLGKERFWTMALGAALTASVPATLEVLVLETLFRPEPDGTHDILALYAQVAVLTIAITVPLLHFRNGARGVGIAQPSRPADAAAPAPFLKRLPLRLGRDLHCLQAEDHYVRVYTAAGNDLVLHRFSDAVTELDGISGLQVHRSWWVAHDAVHDVVRRDRKVYLRTLCGVEVPVSRTYLAEVRRAGLIR